MTTLAVADSSVLIDYLRGHAAARDLLRGAIEGGERVAASVLSRVELLAGMRPDEEAATRRLFDSLLWVPVDDAIAETAGHYAREHLRSHPDIDAVDYVIAATATHLEARLWTRNLRHFLPMLPDLRAPY